MKFAVNPAMRTDRAARPDPVADVVAPARVERRIAALLPRLEPGDIAVLDHLDLDRASARSLVDRGVRAVVNASACTSGRYPTLGSRVLVDAGIVVVDRIGPTGLAAVPDGATVRITEGTLYVADEPIAMGRRLGATQVEAETTAARTGMVSQMEAVASGSNEFLRREQDLILHGTGLPRVTTAFHARPVLVAARGAGFTEHLASAARWARAAGAVVVAADDTADDLRRAGLELDVVVLAHGADARVPSARALQTAQDVIVRIGRGGHVDLGAYERLGVTALTCASTANTEDLGLLLAHTHDASVVVGLGLTGTLEELLDRQHAGLASTYATRLAMGPSLVAAESLEALAGQRMSAWHLAVLAVAGLAVVLAAVLVAGSPW